MNEELSPASHTFFFFKIQTKGLSDSVNKNIKSGNFVIELVFKRTYSVFRKACCGGNELPTILKYILRLEALNVAKDVRKISHLAAYVCLAKVHEEVMAIFQYEPISGCLMNTARIGV